MYEGLALTVLGRVHARLRHPEIRHAESLMEQAIGIFADAGLRPYYALANFYLAEIDAESGQTEKARGHMRVADNLFREMGMDYWVARSREASGRY